MESPSNYLAFSAQNLIAEGALYTVAEKLKERIKQGDISNILYFNAADGRQLDIDLTGAEFDAVSNPESPETKTSETQPTNIKKTRGRPKLGVVGREVTLRPRHWQWLDTLAWRGLCHSAAPG